MFQIPFSPHTLKDIMIKDAPKEPQEISEHLRKTKHSLKIQRNYINLLFYALHA